MWEMAEQEKKEREAEEERLRNLRFFETTSGKTYQKKEFTENTVGRWVMKTQDGGLVPLNQTQREI